jgi:hypothetical protein
MSARKKTKVSADLLLDARCEFHEMIELLGTASGQLREAASDNRGRLLSLMTSLERLPS